MITRRNFLQTSAVSALAANTAFAVNTGYPQPIGTLPTPLGLPSDAALRTHPRSGDPDLRELAMRALDAATRAGASYADVRLTVTRQQGFYYANPPIDSERVAVGVRALTNGAWGFTAGANWTFDAMEQLGQDAARQAKGNTWRDVPSTDLGERPIVASGSWTMPIKRDPFDVAVEEKLDFIRSAEAYARTFPNAYANSIIVFERQERTFASTDGAFCTQTVYNSLGDRSFFAVGAVDRVAQRSGSRSAELIAPTGRGYEAFEEINFLDEIPRMYEDARRMLKSVPVNPSRYDVVIDGYAMASIVNETIGKSLEIDRALGYEANADGTSYLSPVDKILGTNLAPPLLTVTADRSSLGGAATVKWDDEGVAPDTFSLIEKGTVVDYATSREHVKALEGWYNSKQLPLRSHGCSAAGNATNISMVHTPNLVMSAGKNDTSFEEMIESIDDGVAILGGKSLVDQQQLNGQGMPGMMYRIRRGKLDDVITDGAFLFRSPELWKSLTDVGGERSAVWKGFSAVKGQPEQTTVHSVRGVAARFKNMRVITTAGRTSPNGGRPGELLR